MEKVGMKKMSICFLSIGKKINLRLPFEVELIPLFSLTSSSTAVACGDYLGLCFNEFIV